MTPWQEQYLRNLRQIRLLADFPQRGGEGFEAWLAARRAAEEELVRARSENVALLSAYLFPLLDELYSAAPEDLDALAGFADALMDWKTNLDCGVYVVIHDALLTLCRVRSDRDGIIRELYKLGMGYYYLRRMTAGIRDPLADTLMFQNGMLFSEAAGYLRYFDRIDDETTKGYVVRALANIALCRESPREKVAATARALQVIGDESYRAMAPGLPWAWFERGSHQQMSANRALLRESDLSREELATVLDSCYEVFRQEEGAEAPSVRWLWPYYEMEYTCGYASLETTLRRLESLMEAAPEGQYDIPGLYGSVQLPLYYGAFLRDHPQLLREPSRVLALDQAYRKMLRVLLALPPERFDDYLTYLLSALVSDFFEAEGVLSYREVALCLMQRFTGGLYIRSCTVGSLMREVASALYRKDPAAFDEIPRFGGMPPSPAKEEALRRYAWECGLFHAFGQIKMHVRGILQARELLEIEHRIYTLYTVSGHDDLASRASTRDYADIAFGHRSWYSGQEGYPEGYVRNRSPYRLMTDVAAVCVFLQERRAEPFPEALAEVFAGEGQRFSPIVTGALADEGLTARLESILRDDGTEWYRSAWLSFRGAADG